MIKNLPRLYYELARFGARAVGKKQSWNFNYDSLEELLVYAAQLSRHDPRLFSIMVELLAKCWNELNPRLIRQLNSKTESPQNILVMFEFVKACHSGAELTALVQYLGVGVDPVPYQLYFKNLYLPGSRLMERASREALEEFYQWGFLARERPIIYGARRQTLGHWGPVARLNILHRLAEPGKAFQINTYLATLDHTISRQQAVLDLKKAPFLKMVGSGRACSWQLK